MERSSWGSVGALRGSGFLPVRENKPGVFSSSSASMSSPFPLGSWFRSLSSSSFMKLPLLLEQSMASSVSAELSSDSAFALEGSRGLYGGISGTAYFFAQLLSAFGRMSPPSLLAAPKASDSACCGDTGREWHCRPGSCHSSGHELPALLWGWYELMLPRGECKSNMSENTDLLGMSKNLILPPLRSSRALKGLTLGIPRGPGL